MFAPNLPANSTVEAELVAAKEAHDQLKSRYDQYIRKLERLKPELDASRRYLLIMNQLNPHEKANAPKKPQGSLSQDLPVHILQLIFEIAVSFNKKEWIRTALSISQVCQTWRTVALRTSLLWSQIDISMSSDVEVVENLVKLLMERTQSKTPDITISDVLFPVSGVTQPVAEFMGACHLNSFKHIGTLRFRPLLSEDAIHLTHPVFGYATGLFSGGPLDRLVINCQKASATAMSELVLVDLISNFHTAKHISLVRVHDVVFGGEISLFSLQLQQLRRPIIVSSMASLSRLRQLTLVDVSFFNEPDQEDVILPYLETLVVDNCKNAPWDWIVTPSLKNCYIYTEDPNTTDTTSYTVYLCRTPSIRSLLVRLWPETFRLLAEALPNLEFLDISGYYQGLYRWKTIDLLSPPFPALAIIRINLTYSHWISLDDFEQLVRARCLPSGGGLQRTAELHIADSFERLKIASWRMSRYMNDCTMRLARESNWAKGVASIEMKWTK